MDELKPNTADLNTQTRNRAYDIDNDINNATDTTEQLFIITLETIDSAIMYYFENVIKPQVLENGTLVKVPVMYGSQERWKSVNQDGFIRDNKGKLITPLIMYKRNSVAKDTNIPIDKLDANNPQLYYTVQRKYTQKNRFDNYAVLTNQVPVKEYYNIIVPDYIVATYDVILWTTYTKQMNSLIESMMFASDTYWGDASKWKFRTTVSDIATPVEITTEEDRSIRGTFTLTVNGYLVPSTVNKILAQANNAVKKSLSVKKIVLFYEVDSIPAEMFAAGTKTIRTAVNASLSTPPVVGGTTTTSGTGVTAALTQLLTYLNKQFQKTADTVTSDTATWNNVTIAGPPADYPQTQDVKENFIFFVNGAHLEHSAITSFVQSGANAILTVDTTALGYSLDSNDEVIAVGKFDA